MKKASVRDYFAVFLMSLFSTYTIYEKFMLPELTIPMIISIMYLVIFIIFFKLRSETQSAKIYDKISYALFAIFMVIGDSFKQYDSLFGIWGNPFKGTNIAELLFEGFASKFVFLNGICGNILMLFSAICKGIGYYFIIMYLIEWVKRLYFLANNKKIENKLYTKLTNKIFNKHTFFKVFLILVTAWLPYYIVKFPGAICKDAYMQIQQFLGHWEMTTHHPYFSTILIGGCAKIGEMLGNINIGVFIYVSVQYIITAGIFAYCITLVSRFKISRLYSWFLILVYALSPAFTTYATSVVKDTLFCSLFAFDILFLTIIVRNIKNGLPIKNDVIKFAALAFFVTITRNNGIYLIAPTILLLIIAVLYVKKESAANKAKMVAVLILPIVAFAGFNTLQYDILDIKKGSIAEALSIPFQQTARYVRDHGDDVTDEEREIINRVLDYDNLAELYVPTCSDQVKATYKGDNSALVDYFKVWFSQLQKQPLTYIEATLNTSYLAFYPDKMNTRTYIISTYAFDQIGGIFSTLRLAFSAITMGFSLIPIVNIIVNPVFYMWLLIYLSIRSLFKKQYMNLIIFVPMLIQILVIIAGPAVLNNTRYLYPIYWSILIPLAYLSEKKDGLTND